jgi:hypothetical protein
MRRAWECGISLVRAILHPIASGCKRPFRCLTGERADVHNPPPQLAPHSPPLARLPWLAACAQVRSERLSLAPPRGGFPHLSLRPRDRQPPAAFRTSA